MYAAGAAGYYNSDTERYELEVGVASEAMGSEVSVGGYTIKNFRRAIPGFDSVTNKSATTSGRGAETNRELADRYLLQVEGNNPGTPAGVKKYILDNFSAVLDVYVVYGTDTNLTRNQVDAGAVDIWILGSSVASRTYTTAYPGIEEVIVLDRQPLIAVSQVSTIGGVIFTEGTDYEVVTGVGEYSYSNIGSDGIRFLAGGSAPAALRDPVAIIYTYNSLINTLASFFTQPEYYSMGMDKLFRQAEVENIEIEADLKVGFGNPNTVLSNVRTAVMTYVNALLLGIDVEEFDLDREVSKIIGVDNWTYRTLALKGGSGIGDIIVTPNKYARLDSADFVINLV
jgi:hypothetical protein